MDATEGIDDAPPEIFPLTEPPADPADLDLATASIPLPTTFVLSDSAPPISVRQVHMSKEDSIERSLLELESAPRRKRFRIAMGRLRVDWETVAIAVVLCLFVTIVVAGVWALGLALLERSAQ